MSSYDLNEILERLFNYNIYHGFAINKLESYE